MQLTVKKFDELETDELFSIYKLRMEVFIVEQNCPYRDIDDYDKEAYHVYLKEDGDIVAYLRLLPKGVRFSEVSIGRVIAVKRRMGYGSRIVKAGIDAAKEKLDPDRIIIEAQVYAKGLYEKLGFVKTSEEFLEDDIPHIQMTLNLK
ncbi:MAG: GNAT family N-acetyltransferase [Ruminococcaceae bacterium]|nr:GNAT family N-acetyltransferase [Oscillospiraceae bacterium]